MRPAVAIGNHCQAFTLMELLIVVLIVGILASIAMIGFQDYSTSAKEQTLRENVRQLQSAVERYWIDHACQYPGRLPNELNPTSDALILHLTLYSDQQGLPSKTLDREKYPFGPYIKRIPVNPLNGYSVIEVVAGSKTIQPGGEEFLPLPPGGTYGYRYEYLGGVIQVYGNKVDAGQPAAVEAVTP